MNKIKLFFAAGFILFAFESMAAEDFVAVADEDWPGVVRNRIQTEIGLFHSEVAAAEADADQVIDIRKAVQHAVEDFGVVYGIFMAFQHNHMGTHHIIRVLRPIA